MDFTEWLDTFLDEKGTDLDEVFEVECASGSNCIPCEVVIEHMKIAPKNEQRLIKKMLVKIDFCNGSEVDFLKHLAQAIAI